jgi:hypothetical protein
MPHVQWDDCNVHRQWRDPVSFSLALFHQCACVGHADAVSKVTQLCVIPLIFWRSCSRILGLTARAWHSTRGLECSRFVTFSTNRSPPKLSRRQGRLEQRCRSLQREYYFRWRVWGCSVFLFFDIACTLPKSLNTSDRSAFRYRQFRVSVRAADAAGVTGLATSTDVFVDSRNPDTGLRLQTTALQSCSRINCTVTAATAAQSFAVGLLTSEHNLGSGDNTSLAEYSCRLRPLCDTTAALATPACTSATAGAPLWRVCGNGTSTCVLVPVHSLAPITQMPF